MSSIVTASRPDSRERPRRPALSLLRSAGAPSLDSHDTLVSRRPALRVLAGEHTEQPAPVLLAGADACRRAILRAELSATLPARTPFTEADGVSELIERAPASRMVILAGDLDDAPAESLMRLLGQRHPRLPVVSIEASLPAAAGGHG
jgi:hypothetical protein